MQEDIHATPANRAREQNAADEGENSREEKQNAEDPKDGKNTQPGAQRDFIKKGKQKPSPNFQLK